MLLGRCLDRGCSCENVAATRLKPGEGQFWVWELPAHGLRAEGTFRTDAAVSELFLRDFPAGSNHKVTQWQTDTGNCLRTGVSWHPCSHCYPCLSGRDFSILVPACYPFPDVSLSLPLRHSETFGLGQGHTQVTINLQGLSCPHRGRNLQPVYC